MAIIKHRDPKKIILDLGGPDGNAYYLLGYVKKLSSICCLDAAMVSEQMRSGDYKNLVKVFDTYFGHIVDLILPEGVTSVEDLK